MANNKILYAVIAVLALAVIGGGLFLFLSNKGAQEETGDGRQATASPALTPTPASAAEQAMVDCGKMEDPFCFLNRMNKCLPVTAKMTGTDGSSIEITILGQENETCHFQRKINDSLNLDCYFPKGTLNVDTLGQTFGDDKGLQKVVDDACKPVGW